MAQWVETRRRIFNFNIDYQYVLCLLTKYVYYIIAKHNGMATIRVYFLLLFDIIEVNMCR